MYFVYLIINQKDFSYVGYTANINKRILLHNKGKGAKYTKGSKWKLIYCKKYKSKSKALQEEYKLKKKSQIEKLN